MIRVILDNAQSGGSRLKLVDLQNTVLATFLIDQCQEKDNIVIWEMNLSILDVCDHVWENHGIAAKCKYCGQTNATEEVMEVL
ncbi:hypothetical protein LCGC14_0346030 [marine sediment metagenome]|uniref:Uncharacterized protein n=1 Tax=marine sediment metagenome TaxID=412755 RepID=A0A0F9VZL6_9ZZZZ